MSGELPAAPEEAPVLTEVRDSTLIVTINRPGAKNALNYACAAAIAGAMDRLDADSGLTVGILTGAGDSFCAGMDLKAFLRGERPSIPGRGFGGLTMRPPEKPLIAAVNGYALAGGLELALACDLIVAHADAKFGISEVKRGLAARGGGLLQLPRQLPYRLAMELALTGNILPARRAHELGFVNRLSDGSAIDAALVLADEIGANGPLAVRASKQVIARSRHWTDEEMWTRQDEILIPVFESQDAREGAVAFAEKRPPVWQGR